MLLIILLVSVAIGSCHDHVVEPPSPCVTTGWVDRVEGRWVVLDPLGEGDEVLVPVSCFKERVHGGQRVVNGRVDHRATEALRADIRRRMDRLLKAGEVSRSESPGGGRRRRGP